MKRPSVVVLSSCTGTKTRKPHLRQSDFTDRRDGLESVRRRLDDHAVAAEDLYRGQHHLRMMRGVARARHGAHLHIDLRIVSAGYGLVHGSDRLVPYECTFQKLSRAERRQLAAASELAEDVDALLRDHHDLALLLLGEDYLDACQLRADLRLGGTTLVFCSSATALKLPAVPGLIPVALRVEDTKRFSCGLVGLKGEVGGRLLDLLAARPGHLDQLSSATLLDTLATRRPGIPDQAALPVG